MPVILLCYSNGTLLLTIHNFYAIFTNYKEETFFTQMLTCSYLCILNADDSTYIVGLKNVLLLFL